VPELSPELSFDRVPEFCERRFPAQEIHCRLFRQTVDLPCKSKT
jgi:hypothetical protein